MEEVDVSPFFFQCPLDVGTIWLLSSRGWSILLFLVANFLHFSETFCYSAVLVGRCFLYLILGCLHLLTFDYNPTPNLGLNMSFALDETELQAYYGTLPLIYEKISV